VAAFVAEWNQFGRPSDVAIDKNDMMDEFSAIFLKMVSF
jgi:hypothetical protein